MEPITTLAWVASLSAGVSAALGARTLRRATPQQELIEAALRHATMADLQRRLTEEEGVVVRISFVDSLLGPRLWLDAQHLTITMNLFRSLDPSWRTLQGTGAVLRSCEHREGRGWTVELETLAAPRRATGWKIDVAPRRAPAERPAAVPPF